SVLNHVLLHQTVIGLEAQKQMNQAEAYPDIVVGCVGGGSNFAGLAFPFIADKLTGKNPQLRAIAVEPAACPSLTKGVYTYDYGDTAGLAPMVKMHTLGHSFIPPSIHAGGLRYHGMSPLVSALYNAGIIEARALPQIACFEAAVMFARSEGIVPAPETSHAIRAAVDEALACRERGETKTILFNLSGHGHFDMQAYDDYFAGKLTDTEFNVSAVKESLAHLPQPAGAR
ncbi:MAG: pyridoxal-phosphate dependent enzyme, partial [Chloroflexi bacterium]|nr:pyridoxal-phosphate dependent enzyme [Chloroflexota bacterium]